MKKALKFITMQIFGLSFAFKTKFTKVPETFTSGVNMIAHNNPRPKYSYILPPRSIYTLSGPTRI